MKKIIKDSSELIGNTPMLLVNNIDTGPCNLYLKLESENLGGSVKDRPARNMLEIAEKKGLIKRGGTIVEATAGNTGIALAIIAAKKGYKTIIVVPDKMTLEKVHHLRALGAEVIVTRSDVYNGHPEYYLDIAKKIAKEKKAFYINQFINKANIRSHFKELGPEIYFQLNKKVDAFVAGVGTGGTISGVGKYLKNKNKKCEIILADPKGSILKKLIDTGKISKTVGSWIVEGIGEDFCPPLLDTNLINKAYYIDDKEAVKTCNTLLKKEGILSGSSSGTLIAAAIKYCREQKHKKNVVTLVCDSGDKYLRKVYNENWRIKEGFEKTIKNDNLLDIVTYFHKSKIFPTVNIESDCSLAFKLMGENNLNYILVEDKNKNIIGVVDDKSLVEAVIKGSFKAKIKNYVIKLKKIQYNETIKKFIKTLKENNYVLLYKNKTFMGVLNSIDFLYYLKKNEHAKEK
tara:strand:- start:3249 stop:4625 length:1377 start_codon:yes stop_codon:yes gene_type:complete